ncbi:MAG: hypothetical protein ABR591_15015, partial [Candidatus Velthaea sp.]
MPLALISAEYPCGASEAFIEAELRALAAACGGVIIYPTLATSGRRALPAHVEARVFALVSARTLLVAAGEFVRRPRRAARALRALLCFGGTPTVRVKDLAIFAKALCVARDVRRRGVEHVHAYWFSTPASLAYVVAELTGVPYSITAHRWDIYAPLGQARKARSAHFIRTISQRGAADLSAIAKLGPAAARVAVVHLGVDVPAAAAPARERAELNILVPASLVGVKDHATLLHALARLEQRGTPFRCTLAGDGPLRAAL